MNLSVISCVAALLRGTLIVLGLAAFSGCAGDAPGQAEACLRSSDCSDPRATCVEQVCLLECGDDRDCPEGTACADGQCLAATCRADTDCRFDQECQQGTCVEVSGFCERNRDCPSGQACSREARRCVDSSELGGACAGDLDCFAGELCVSGTCEEASSTGCVRNSDCDDGEICLDERCAPECAEDRDCAPDQICDRGRCEQSSPNNNTGNNNGTSGTTGGTTGNTTDGTTGGGTTGGTTGPVSCTDDPNACSSDQQCCQGTCVAQGTCNDYWAMCSAAAQCSTELCLGGASGHCTQRCSFRTDCPQAPVSSLCIQNYHLVTQVNGGNALVGLCFEDDTGESCNPSAPDNCFDGLCVGRQFNSQGQCSIRCQSATDCRPGYACGPKEFAINGQPQVVNVCVPVGEFCQGTGAEAAEFCFSSFCAAGDNNRGFCTTLCSSAASCPEGWSCIPAGDGVGFCGIACTTDADCPSGSQCGEAGADGVRVCTF